MVAVNSTGQLDGNCSEKKTREPVFLPICLKSRTHSSPRWLSFKGKADTASTLNLNCETLSTFKQSRLLAAAAPTRRRERGPRGRGLCGGRGTRVGAPGCGRRGTESPCVLHVRSEASSLRPSAQSAIPEFATPEGRGGGRARTPRRGNEKNPCGCAWRRQPPGGDAAPVAPWATPAPSVICAEHLQAQGALVVAQREGSVFWLFFFFSPPKEKTFSDSPEQNHITPACSDGESAGLRRNIKWWDSSSGNALAWPSTARVWLA